MGKKSKKGVVRTNTKKHNAAGQGKASSTNTKTLGSGRGTSSCDNSLDSNSVVFNNMKQTTGNTGSNTSNNTVAVTPMPIVHVKEQLLPPAQSQQRSKMTEEEIRNMIINNIALQRSMNNKENKSDDGMPSITVLSGKQPTVFTLDLDTGSVEDVAEVEMPHFDDQVPPVEKTTNMTTIEATSVDVQSTPAAEKALDEAIIPTTEHELVPKVDVVPEVTQNEPEDPPTVPAMEEPVATLTEPTLTVTDAVPEKEDAVVKAEEPIPPAPVVAEQNSDSQQQQQQIWSSTLRSIVSADEDEAEVLADDKAVMDITPLKQSKLVVPIIQTVSPSPEQLSKPSKISYLKEEPIPSLDTPDQKDLDRNVKQDLCGCCIM
jgi:hypothetical protein